MSVSEYSFPLSKLLSTLMVSTQLNIEYNENDKEKNKKISAYVQAKKDSSGHKYDGSSEHLRLMQISFDVERVNFYGDDWLSILRLHK